MTPPARINVAAVIDTREFDDDFEALVRLVDATWRVVRYSATDDTSLRRVIEATLGATDRVGVLEIIAHASPECIGGIQLAEVRTVGPDLEASAPVDEQTRVYLSGCNTACSDGHGGNLAKAFASHTAATTFGSLGYLTGFSALENERTTETFGTQGRYDCSQDATGRRCWQEFQPMAELAPGVDAGPNVLARIELDRVQELVTAALSEPPLQQPLSNRIGPDAVIAVVVPPSDSPQSFAILGNGAFLRTEDTAVVRRFPGGREVMELLFGPRVR